MIAEKAGKMLRLRTSIVRRLILYILLIGLLITIIGTGAQLYIEYNHDLENAKESLEQIESIHLSAIISSLWVTDYEHLEMHINGMLQMPYIKFIKVYNGDKILQAAGTPQSENIIEKTIPLIYPYNEKDVYLGELHITASLQGFYDRIFDHFLMILSFQTINIFLVALFILVFFYRLVGRHLISLAAFTGSMSYDSKYLPFILDRKPKTKSPDELERLVTSFNTMRENLAKDIKGRELAEEELRQNERIVSTSADMLALLNKDFIYLAANDAYVKEFNKSQDEIVGHTVSEVFGEEFFETVIKDNATRCMNGEVINFQDWFDFPLSGRCFMDITYYPYYNSENDITGFVVSGRDITDRKKSDQALTESEEKLNLIINTSPIGICTVDQLGNFITTNPVYERMVGHSKEECRSLSFFDVTHPDDRPKNKKLFQSMFSLEATGFSMKKRYIHKDGSVIDVDVHAVGIMDADGKIRFGTAFVNDITDNKIKEKEIEDKSRELENQFDKSEKQRIATLSVLTDLNASSKKLREEITERINAENKLKAINQQLTANEQQLKANEEEIKINLKEKIVLIQEIYHRTKNNMAVISSMLSMQSRRSDNEFVNTTFKEIINKIKAMSLVHQKLYQSKNLSNIDFKEYVEDLAKLLMQSFGAESRKIDSKLELENVNILIDSAIPLGLILNELVSNIFKHAFPNKKDGKIFIRLFKDDDNIINLQLSDNGIGLPHNFDIRKDGSMGLSSVFSLVERQLKGSISAKSENGLKWHIKINDSLHQERV